MTISSELEDIFDPEIHSIDFIDGCFVLKERKKASEAEIERVTQTLQQELNKLVKFYKIIRL